MTTTKNERLKNARKEKGLTQIEVANKASVSERTYQEYEAGGRVPNVRIARLIAEALGKNIEDIF